MLIVYIVCMDLRVLCIESKWGKSIFLTFPLYLFNNILIYFFVTASVV
jgi:hypothetical protein